MAEKKELLADIYLASDASIESAYSVPQLEPLKYDIRMPKKDCGCPPECPNKCGNGRCKDR